MRPTTIVAAIAIASFAVGSAAAQQTAPMGAQGQRQGQNMAYCLQGSDGSQNCGFANMAQCEAAKKGQATNSTCVRNRQTTGSGAKPSPVPTQPTTGMTPSNPSGGPMSRDPSGTK